MQASVKNLIWILSLRHYHYRFLLSFQACVRSFVDNYRRLPFRTWLLSFACPERSDKGQEW